MTARSDAEDPRLEHVTARVLETIRRAQSRSGGPPPSPPATLEGAALSRALAAAGVEEPHRSGSRLSSFNPDPDRAPFEAAVRYVEAIAAGRRPNLYITSARPREAVAAGAGKTHLAVAIVAELLRRRALEPADVAVIRETRLAIELRSAIAGGRPEALIRSLGAKALVVIDDVGKASTDSAWLRELFFELAALREARATIRTSNWAPQRLAEREPDLHLPLLSRYVAGGAVLVLRGPDRR